MTSRKKLIELLTGYSIDTKNDVEYVVDRLIENGVTVLPCKVGDTVYAITEKRPCLHCAYLSESNELCDCEKTFCKFKEDKDKLVVKEAKVCHFPKPYYDFLVEYDETRTIRSYSDGFFFNQFGETIFFTKEEAEAKLKESEQNDRE